METSIILARILGPMFIIIDIGVLFNSNAYQKIADDFFKNDGLCYLGGFIVLILGLTIFKSIGLLSK